MQAFRESLPMLLYGALDTVMPRFRAIFKEFGLTEPQWRVLRVLWERDTIGAGELADITLISPPSLVGVIDRMTALGLVRKQRSDTDRRAAHVCLTDAGRVLQAQVMPLVDATYAELEASVDPRTWAGLVRGLQQIGHSTPSMEQAHNE